MPISNIRSVNLNADGSVTINGAFTDMAGRKVELLHIWLAQPEVDGVDGVGLATDALSNVTVTSQDGAEFTLPNVRGAGGGFRHGPAVVSAIAVISPASSGGVSQVIQWSRSLTLSPTEGKHVGLSLF
jgi:hypothetical protein